MERNVYAHQRIDASLDDVVQAFQRDAAAVLGPLIGTAEQGDDPVTVLRATVDGAEFHREVRVHTQPVEQVDAHAYRMPLVWHESHGERLYPVMHGAFEMAALSISPPLTEITFMGHYRPPLGLLGAMGDTLIGGRIADQVTESLVDDVVGRLHELLMSQHEVEADATG